MSRNGSGQMNLPAGNPVVSGTIIDPAAFNSTMSDIANELTNSIPRDGQAPPTNNLPMGGYRHTNVANAQNRNEYATVAQVQDAAVLTLSGVTGTDTITATINPPITAYAAGQKFKGVMAGTNTTTSPTLNINSLGAVSIVMPGGGAPAIGAIPANGAEFYHNGTKFVLMNPVIAAGTIGTSQLADASVTAAKLADASVTAAKLAAGAAAANLAAGSVVLAKLDQTGLAGQVLSGQGTGNPPAWGYPPVLQRSALVVSYTGTNGVVTSTANALTLQNALGQSITLTGWNQSATSGNASGAANSLDTGSWAFLTWYYLFAIYNPTTTTRALLWSLSATAPTLPSGYTHFCRIGANKTQGVGNYWFLGGTQADRTFQYRPVPGGNITALPMMASGAAGNTTTPTWLAVAVSGFTPTTASRICVIPFFAGSGGGQVIVAPNTTYGGYASTTNPPVGSSSGASGLTPSTFPVWMTLESTNIYWASSGSVGILNCFGWEDNL